MAEDRPSRAPDHVARRSNAPVRTHEEMAGGEGREVFFRPDRISQEGLGAVGVVLSVRRGAEYVPCALYDLSQSGVALL